MFPEKMFADSSFYEDPDQKYPTIQQQIKMAREVAHLLTSPSGPSGRGQQMFLKRQQMSSQWKPESGTILLSCFTLMIVFYFHILFYNIFYYNNCLFVTD